MSEGWSAAALHTFLGVAGSPASRTAPENDPKGFVSCSFEPVRGRPHEARQLARCFCCWAQLSRSSCPPSAPPLGRPRR